MAGNGTIGHRFGLDAYNTCGSDNLHKPVVLLVVACFPLGDRCDVYRIEWTSKIQILGLFSNVDCKSRR